MIVHLARLAVAASLAAIVMFGWCTPGSGHGDGPTLREARDSEVSAAAPDTPVNNGRVGKIVDAQGVCLIRSATAERWTPVETGGLAMPQDWLRTDPRGANAMTLRLVNDTRVTLGPGTMVEVLQPNRIRVDSGDVHVTAPEKVPFEVVGPDRVPIQVAGAQTFRVATEKLVRLAQEPQWLKGFSGKTADESIGTLVANIDGRNTPLTVGYHKVTVDIRDQIARTVVEESFVNHTAETLEGVFHFPLPQDASISGFGMWIGDELVEADVVEKQRAREIYETILRERRDPGLLEWTGGNIFKARVFPIPARAEKRIKITYTQVLPMQGGAYRYSYALQSELLKQHPLRQLAITVNVSSVMPLKGVASPTHPVRVQQTAHSARFEFSAQEHTPNRDFEVLAEVDERQSDVVLIPHRRGEDGYFMVLLTPVGLERPERAQGTDGMRGELELLVLADTSASMDRAGRAAQADFVAALLSSLGPKDRFTLACCDVECDWAFPQFVAAEDKNVQDARDFLARRSSLGWTDLDQAFAAALARSTPKTRIVYVGDGIVTTGDADPVSFAKRLRKLYEGRTATCHAVSVGSSFESGVLNAIAACGGGSVRQIGGERGPQATARELLDEIARPALRDLRVEFRGIRAARVYPEQLPNLPAGRQQIILGRYLPDDKDQTGEVVVTGTFDGRPVRYASLVSLKDAEAGNSFIPRLWARMHLDYLLAQGASQAVQDQVVALSEEYHIMTPYTSLLVLETDADRERFKVQRRFLMRDGERFFAQARDNVNFDLVQQQMKRAGTWRLGLRQAALSQLVGLGRDPRLFEPHRFENRLLDRAASMAPSRSSGGRGRFLGVENFSFWDTGNDRDGVADSSWMGIMAKPQDEVGRLTLSEEEAADLELDMYAASRPDDSPVSVDDGAVFLSINRLGPAGGDLMAAESLRENELQDTFLSFEAKSVDRSSGLRSLTSAGRYEVAERGKVSFFADGQAKHFAYAEPAGLWLENLFPGLPAPRVKAEPPKPKKPWPAEAKILSDSLLRIQVLQKLSEGLRMEQATESFEPRRAELTGRSTTVALHAPQAWLTQQESVGSQRMVHWCDGKERGGMALGFQLGRIRPAVPADLRPETIGLPLDHFALSPLELSYLDSQVSVERPANDRAVLTIARTPDSDAETVIVVDTARHVVVSVEQRQAGKVVSAMRHDEFVELAGAWWATRIEALDGKGRRTSLTTTKLTSIPLAELSAAIQQQLAGREQIQFLRQPLPSLVDAKRAGGAGKATFEDHFVLMGHFGQTQQWTRVHEHLARAEELAAGKPGMPWVRNAVLNASRRRDELKTRIMEQAGTAGSGDPRRTERRTEDDLFVANHLLGQAASIFEANEMLGLLDSLRHVFERQPAYARALRNWQEQRVNYLQRTGQADEALRILSRLADAFPLDVGLQQRLANTLAQAGEHAAAERRLRGLLGGEHEWYPHEVRTLRETLIQQLQASGRWAESVELLSQWTKQDSEDPWTYEQYLSALVRLGRDGEVDSLAGQWLRDAQVSGRLAPTQLARLNAALRFMLGQLSPGYQQRLDERWLQPLADAALFFARHGFHASIAETIANEHRFSQTDPSRRLRRLALGILEQELEKLSPEPLSRFVGWALGSDSPDAERTWRKLAQRLRQRWAAEQNSQHKGLLDRSLTSIYGRLTADERLDFFRERLRKADPEQRAACVRQLYDLLLAMPWTTEREAEAFRMLELLSDAPEEVERLFAQLAALHQFTDRMVEARYQSAFKAVEHPERLTRLELAAKQKELREQARVGLADRFRQDAAKRTGPFAEWMTVERLTLDVQAGRNLPQVAEDCWELLGPPHPRNQPVTGQSTVASSPDRARVAMATLQEDLHHRLLVILANLATRKGAPPSAVERLLADLDARIAAAEVHDLRWKVLKYQLLVVLDRPEDIENSLRQWVAADGPINRWRLMLGYLLAEQGKLAEAIPLFEAVRSADELGPAEHRTLADWYVAVNRREDHERSQINAYKTMEEWRLSNVLSQRLQLYRRPDRRVPAELDREVLLVFAALFEKSSQPQNYVGMLQQYYRETRDFRLLSGLADAVVGQTAGRVYPLLQSLSSVLGEIRDEATADSVVEHIGKIRGRAATPVDQRALDLLETLVERRAAEVLNQPGPHADRALVALQRSFQREWTSGEPRLMADFLAGLGRITAERLAAEQVLQLEMLHKQAASTTIDGLHIAVALANAHWSHGRRDAAIDLLQLELRKFERANGGKLPPTGNVALSRLVGFFEEQGHYARGETLLLEHLQRPANQQQRHWFTQRLYELYDRAIGADGEVSFGKGPTLYRAMIARIEADLATPDPSHRQQLFSRLCAVFRTAHARKMAGVANDLRAFVFERSPAVLKRDLNQYSSLVHQLAYAVHDVGSPRDGLACLVLHIEQEPRWLRFSNQDGWGQHGWLLAQWRHEAGELGDWEPRLLKIVLAELREDLRTRQQRNRNLYHRHHNYFWEQKADDFARVAEEVYQQRKESGAAVAYVADYFYHGLHRFDRAIEVLLAAHHQSRLDESAEAQLVRFLHERNRHGESIAILLPWVETRPDNMQYRTWLLHAYFRTQQPGQLTTLLKQTDEHFHKDGRWTESNMAALANSCLENELYDQSVAYYKELVPLHERTQPNRGIGGGALSQYYMNLARAFAGLKKTAEAVDAASGAIVSWGPRHDRRADALRTLADVIRGAPQLDAYVAELDQQSATTGLHNPIVRKTLGQVYLERREFPKALAQLKLAVDLQPNDTETHQALVGCYDQQNDKDGAAAQLLRSLDLSRRDIKLYTDLGQRYEALNRRADAERAFTSMVEMQAAESESHAALAEIRQRQNRWPEAIAEWRHVARLRALEPTGLLNLAEAQLHERLWPDADATLKQLETRSWPTRFGDTEQRTRAMRNRLEQARQSR